MIGKLSDFLSVAIFVVFQSFRKTSKIILILVGFFLFEMVKTFFDLPVNFKTPLIISVDYPLSFASFKT